MIVLTLTGEVRTIMDGMTILVARRRAGLRQYELANRIGMRDSLLSEIETGRKPCPDELIPRLRAVLGEHLRATEEAARDDSGP
jgi:ribosome-binding protein aMBF1 (putative translation factor)